MSLELTDTIGGVLDIFRDLLSASGIALEFFEYDQKIGGVSLGTVQDKWVAYSKEGDDGKYQELIITDDAVIVGSADAEIPDLATMMKKPTHVKIGELYYKLNGAPEQPLETLDAVRYWLIRCAHTGKKTLGY